MLTVTSLRAHILSARLNVCCGGIALMRIELNVAYVGMVLLRLLLVAFFLYFYGLRFWHGLCVALCFTLMTTNFLPYRVRMMIFDVRLITWKSNYVLQSQYLLFIQANGIDVLIYWNLFVFVYLRLNGNNRRNRSIETLGKYIFAVLFLLNWMSQTNKRRCTECVSEILSTRMTIQLNFYQAIVDWESATRGKLCDK